MKVKKILCSICMVALAIPMLANAEIYKWKDKNGVTRYSDMPPPTNVKSDTLGKREATKTTPDTAPAKENEQLKSRVEGKAENEGQFEEVVDPEEDAARVRALNEDNAKKKMAQEKEQAKRDAQNCKAAKANYATFAQGGRVYLINENGEREYFDTEALKGRKAKAQSEIKKFCK